MSARRFLAAGVTTEFRPARRDGRAMAERVWHCLGCGQRTRGAPYCDDHCRQRAAERDAEVEGVVLRFIRHYAGHVSLLIAGVVLVLAIMEGMS